MDMLEVPKELCNRFKFSRSKLLENDLTRQGTHLITRLDRDTVQNLFQYCLKHEIPNYVKKPYNEFHCTLLSTARKCAINDIVYTNKLVIPPSELEVIKVKLRDEFILMITIKNADLINRKLELAQQYQCAPGSSPHITLSYKVGNFKFKSNFKVDFPIIFWGERVSSFQFIEKDRTDSYRSRDYFIK